MVGDGPDLAEAVRLRASTGLADDVQFLGDQDQVVPLLSVVGCVSAAVGPGELRPRGARSDGVRSAGGGVAHRRLPEVVEDGVTGFSVRSRRPRGHGSGRHSLVDRRAAASADGARCTNAGCRAVRRHENCSDVRGVLRRDPGALERQEGRQGRQGWPSAAMRSSAIASSARLPGPPCLPSLPSDRPSCL